MSGVDEVSMVGYRVPLVAAAASPSMPTSSSSSGI